MIHRDLHHHNVVARRPGRRGRVRLGGGLGGAGGLRPRAAPRLRAEPGPRAADRGLAPRRARAARCRGPRSSSATWPRSAPPRPARTRRPSARRRRPRSPGRPCTGSAGSTASSTPSRRGPLSRRASRSSAASRAAAPAPSCSACGASSSRGSSRGRAASAPDGPWGALRGRPLRSTREQLEALGYTDSNPRALSTRRRAAVPHGVGGVGSTRTAGIVGSPDTAGKGAEEASRAGGAVPSCARFALRRLRSTERRCSELPRASSACS